MSRVDIIDIPIVVTVYCKLCRATKNLVTWIPRRNWEEYAKTEIYKCPSCGSYCNYKKSEEGVIDFYIDNNQLFSKFKNFPKIKPCRLMNLKKNVLSLLLNGLTGIPFNGQFRIVDNQGYPLVTFYFGSKGIQYVELNQNLLIRYGTIVDEESVNRIRVSDGQNIETPTSFGANYISTSTRQEGRDLDEPEEEVRQR